MLRRIIAIKNVGRFRNSVATPNPALARRTLVFAPNAYGKTTFCTIMRSVQSGDGGIILGRKTLGSAAPPEIDLLFADGNRRFHSGGWSGTEPKISVFDGTFVAANVHSGDVVDVAHRRNLYRVIIGRDGVDLAEKEQLIAEQARAKQAELTAAERAAQALVPRGMALRDYLNIPADATVDAKLETQRQIINALRQAEAIRTRPALAPLSALSIPSTISATLAKTIESVAADAEARLTIHIRRHGMQEQGERWIGEGIPYVVEDECPFCGRDGLGDLDLIKSYQAHFSEAYESLSREVARLRADVDRTFGDAAQGRIQTQIERNAAALEFWQHHCAVNRAAMRLEDHALAQVQQVRAGLTALLDRKASAPLQPINDAPELREVARNLTEVAASIEAYDAVCAKANGLI